MNILVTGGHGTLGKVLVQHLQSLGHHVTVWDRHQVHPLDFDQQERYLQETQTQALFHLAIASHGTGLDNEGWRINVEWSEHLARLSQALNITFVFTSTALVFNNSVSGPFTTSSTPNADEGYGFEKRIAEERVRAANPDARIVRLGWQIGTDFEGNQMLAFAANQQQQYGGIAASTRWLPACSFLTDTAEALASLLDKPAGLYMANSNSNLTFYEILLRLKQRHQTEWRIVATQQYVYDQRLLDPSLVLPALEDKLQPNTSAVAK